ncbi:MAG: hypothetical protein ACRENE_32075 [Polyangiaceae bacterium]
MDLRADAKIPFPCETVFRVYRDDIVKVVPYMTNVQSIEIRSRKDDGPHVDFVNEWKGGGDVPAAVRAVLSESMLSWTDYARWSADALTCDWRIETHAMKEALSCKGQNRFVEDGPGATRLEIRGKFDVDASKIRGVPRLLAGTVGRAVEEFMVSKIQSNLVETAKSLTAYLEDQAKKSP